jgi:tRNA(fMet)-specific endonuclease VapC
MTTRFMLKTNALSQLVRDPRGTIGTRLRDVGGDSNAFTSIIVASIDVAPLESGVDPLYAEIRHELESKGTPIGSNDLLIAAHALEQRATLVTDNVAEYQRVPGLHIESWVRP